MPRDRHADRVDYGVDRPARLLTLIALASVCLLAALFLTAGGLRLLAVLPFAAATVLGGSAFAWARSSSLERPRVWAELLGGLDLVGDERSIDMGCGKGLVLLAVAQRLERGHSVGVDLWRSADLSGNDRGATEANADLLGVANRVEIITGDALDPPAAHPLETAGFDIVTASLLLSSLSSDAQRERAVAVMCDLLAPGGRMLIVDHKDLTAEAAWLRRGGLTEVCARGNLSRQPYPKLEALTARRPSAQPPTPG